MSPSTPLTPSTPLPVSHWADDDLWRMSVDRYERMVAAAEITPDDRVELLEGVLVKKMSKSPAHSLSVSLVCDVLRPLVRAKWHLRGEQPIRMDDSEPEPDAVVERGAPRDYANRHPMPPDVSLIIEVADSSLQRDRQQKRRIYARNGIPIYWIVNVVDRVIEVHSSPSSPGPSPDYSSSTTFRSGDAVPVILDGATVGMLKVADVLP